MDKVAFENAPWNSIVPLMVHGEYVQVASFYKHTNKYSISKLNRLMKDKFCKFEQFGYLNFILIDDLCDMIRTHKLMAETAIKDLQSLKKGPWYGRICDVIKNIFYG